jgi:hypothetical protein
MHLGVLSEGTTSSRDCERPEGRRKVICPNCGAEYQPGFTRCFDCLVDLVEPGCEPAPGSEEVAEPALEPEDVAEPGGPAALTEPVCVYSSSLRGRLPLAKSLLQSVGIPFTVLGEHVQQLTGIDAYGLAQIYVSTTDADDARAVLADLG